MTTTEEMVDSLVEKYGRSRKALLPILQGVYNAERYVSEDAMVHIARRLDIAAAEVYGKCTFYSFLDTIPRGKFVIRVCKTIVCDMHKKSEIVKELEKQLKIKMGETTLNRKFSLLYTNCLGWCHKGPAMLINDEVYTELTPDKVRRIISEYKNK